MTTSECPSCHAADGRPHTEYCPDRYRGEPVTRIDPMTIVRHQDGTLEITDAPMCVGFSHELLATADGSYISVDAETGVVTVSDCATSYRYRPVETTADMVICEKVTRP